jgi:uncharacterized protein (TIGR02687 family)
MSVETIANALRRIYDDKDEKIVIWYDDEGGFKERYDALELDGVEKIEADRNLFWIKYRIYYEAPQHKYLIYIPSPKPSPRDNWLLDISLSYYEFKADESSINIQEMGLDLRLKPVLDRYAKFFRNEKNKSALNALLETHDDDETLIKKMISVATGVKNDTLEDVLYMLIQEMLNDKVTKYKNLQKYELLDEFWKRVAKQTGYFSEDPSLMGLVIYLFDNRFRLCIKDAEYEGNKSASLFVNHWMQHVKYRETFKTLSKQIEKELQIKEHQLSHYTLEVLMECDTYEGIEQLIIQELSARLISGSVSISQLSSFIDLRKSKFWYSDFKNYYSALYWAAKFNFLKENASLKVKSIEQGIEAYTSQWYQFDYAYRKYLYAVSKCTNSGIFDMMTDEIEKFYANHYLLTLSEEWYDKLGELEQWKFQAAIDQKQFFAYHVAPQITDNKKLCIIISDALRYESGKELNERFLTEGSIRTDFSHMIASLPSYTQLGMASLLPHEKLSYKAGKFEVYADDISTQGTANRTKILQKHVPESIAIQASEFLSMKKTEMRQYFKPYKLVYIYENSIDSRGKPPTEDQVFEATEECFDRLTRLTKKIHNDLQWRNVFITADHGYLYEKTDVDESNFCKVPRDDRWSDSNKRMAIGNDLEEASCVKMYNAEQLNIAGDTQFLIAKSMQRIRAKGGGSKFVHGGATLQEVIIPLIKVNRNTELKSRPVDFDVIRSSSMITANIFPVTFLQKEPVAEKVLPQHIQVSIWSQEGELLSDVYDLIFDSKEKDPAKMHQKVTFRFSKDLTSLNGQSVYLKVMTKAQGTNDFNKELKEKQDQYTINISFGAEEW